jgi:Na+-exporting ATPase
MMSAPSESMSSEGGSNPFAHTSVQQRTNLTPPPITPSNAPFGQAPHTKLDRAADAPTAICTAPPFDPKEVPWHTLTIDDVKRRVGLDDASHGIPSEIVKHRREVYGSNVIPTGSGPNIFKIIFGNFVNAITIILVFVAVVTAYFHDWPSFGICIFVIGFVGVIGAYQEWNAAASLESLKSMSKGTATVIRDGSASVVSIDEVVIGDVVVLEQGTNVPADLRMFDAIALEIDEALLTGENAPVKKTVKRIDKAADCPLGDRANMAFRNTIVTNGRGKGIAVAGGVNTEMGKVAAELSKGEGDAKTPLQRRMDRLMYVIFATGIILVIIVYSANRWDLDESIIIYGAAFAIAILPESLIAVVAIAMALSVRKMASQKCIVRKLGSLEILDSVTDICCYKTGTLTQNKMVVRSISVGVEKRAGRTITVTGKALAIEASFTREDEPETSDRTVPLKHLARSDRRYADFFKCAALCGTTVLKRRDSMIEGTGNPTEVAIQALCWKTGCPRNMFEQAGYQSKGAFPLDSTIKRMSAVYKHSSDGTYFACTKGAPEQILQLCRWKYPVRSTDHTGGDVPEDLLDPLTDSDRAAIQQTISRFAKRGLRTICLARRNNFSPVGNELISIADDETADKYARADVESNLIYLGVVGIYDPPRLESRLSVNICQRAGITVRMLTGDHFETAAAIAKEIDIIDDAISARPGAGMVGPDFDRLTDDEARAMEDHPKVVGRCSPQTKVRMIKELHRRGRVVAMTGDGFNDSASIQAADIGCAMGSGTDVTKGVAELVITDDNFATIVRALVEGRRIALAISKFVTHLLCSNMAETVVMVFGLAITLNERSVFILSPMQILWLNLVTSAPAAIGLSVDPAPEFILHVPPNSKGLFSKELFADTVCYGVVMGLCSLCSFIFVLYGPGGNGPEGHDCNTSQFHDDCDAILRARTTGFLVLYFGIMIHAYNVRYARVHLFRMRWFDNPWLWGSFVFGAMTALAMIYIPALARYVFVHGSISWEWGVVVVALVIFIAFCEAYKMTKNSVDPVPKYHVTPEEAEEERRLFHGDRRLLHDVEPEKDQRTVETIASDDVETMRRLKCSFVSPV